MHLDTSPNNETHVSKVTTAELLKSISNCVEKILAHMKETKSNSILADENTDIASKQELSICGRRHENGKPVEHFLGMVHWCMTYTKVPPALRHLGLQINRI